MPYPNLSFMAKETREGYDGRIADSYLAQLYLRKHLNRIHKMFYHPSVDLRTGPDEKDFTDVSVVTAEVENMNWCAPSLKFAESDPPADNILAARLRAKYWGAQVITYRPFIKQILQFSHNVAHTPGADHGDQALHFSEFRERVTAPQIHPDAKVVTDINPKVIEYANLGIRALISSTQAFHGVDNQRLIITNVFGTAHA
jgi:hypothetical protein